MKLKSITVSSKDGFMITKYTMKDGLMYAQAQPCPASGNALGGEVLAMIQSFDQIKSLADTAGWNLLSQEEEQEEPKDI